MSVVLASARFGHVLWAESRAELLKQIRLPAYVLPTLLFPAMFYVVFGLAFGGNPLPGTSTTMSAYLVATYGAFGIIGAALFGIGIGVATERAQGWLTLKRASPMPPLAYFGAKVMMAMLFGAIITGVLALLAVTMGNVRLPIASWSALFAALVLGAIPFCALGCAIGYLAGPNSAPAITNLVYLPTSLASGLWIPLEVMPKAIREFAPFLPPYHLSRLALRTLGADSSSALGHMAALAGFTVLFLALALWAYRRDEGKTYG